MARLAVLLSGEHPTLPEAEVRSLLAVHEPAARTTKQGLILLIDTHHPAKAIDAVARAALVMAWGEWWDQDTPDAEGLSRMAGRLATRTGIQGAVAVEAQRSGQHKPDSSNIERALGTALKQAGARIRLGNPEHTVFAWSHPEGLFAGLLLGRGDRSRFEARHVDERDHFSPVSLHPRRAASLLHLARVPVGGTVYDPFCGTGGVVLEAALEGHVAIGSDLDQFMVQGTLQTLADAGPEPLDALVFIADIASTPGLVDQVDGIVSDLPYGRASSTMQEDLASLYERAIASFAKLLRPGGRAVVGCARPDLLPAAAKHGFDVAERHAEFVHRSLTRHYTVLQRVG
jgi:tRNA (guanine10-N2)-dimethyltransferase